MKKSFDRLNNLFEGKIDETLVLGGTVAERIHDIPATPGTLQQDYDRSRGRHQKP